MHRLTFKMAPSCEISYFLQSMGAFFMPENASHCFKAGAAGRENTADLIIWKLSS